MTSMAIIDRIFGSGGGGKGGSGAVNEPNTLASNARAKIIEVISEGPIEGIVDGEKGIYFDQTPIMNSDSTLNFEGVVWEEHKGYPDEAHFNGSNAVETPVEVSVQVKQATGPVQRTIVDQNADAVRVLVRIPALVKYDSSNGSVLKTSLQYAVDVRSYGGAWIEVVNNHIVDEKTTSPVQIAHYIKLPFGGTPWDIRVRRITADSTTDGLQNDLYFDGYVVLVEGKFTYPHSAAVYMEVNAKDLGSTIPPRAYHVRGMLINVPTNYDPETRTYTGIWDGTFKVAWSDSPPWIFNDILTNDRYGLGEFIDASIVDKWSLYTIAQYCDQMIPSGYKNSDTGEDIYEPRFTFNGVINQREEAFFVLQQITQAWRGMAYWSLGQVFATADMPSDPVKLVTPANVLGGQFFYSSTAMKARHSVAIVSWNDPDDFYRASKEVVINQAMLNRYGWREKQVQLTGCKSRGLAHRYGKWVLDTEQHETETVEYSASWDHADIRPGQIISIADPAKAQIRIGGRIVNHNNLTIEIDGDFVPTDGETYELMLTMPSGAIEKRSILAFLDERTIRLATAFSDTALPNAVFTITGTDIVPRQYRVITVQEKEPNVFHVMALFHDPLKFARVEQNILFDPLPYSKPSTAVPPPDNLAVVEQGYISNGTPFYSLLFSWTPPQDTVVRGYVVSADAPDGSRVFLGTILGSSVEMSNTSAGVYTFHVQTINFAGVLSEVASIEYTASGVEGFAPPIVTDLTLKNSTTTTEFTGRDLRVVWKNNFANSITPTADEATPAHVVSPHYSHNIVRIYNAVTDDLLREQRVSTESFTYDYASNLADSIANGETTPARSLRVEVNVYDVFGRTTDPASDVFTNPVPAAIAPTYNVIGSSIFMSYPTDIDLDFAGVILWRSDTPGIDTATDEPLYDGASNPIVIPGTHDTLYYFRIAAYDDFGKTDLNISTEFSISTLLDGADTIAPETPTGLNVTSTLIAGRARIVATWDENTETDLAGYDLEVMAPGGGYVSFPTNGLLYEFDGTPGEVYSFRIRAIDRSGNKSSFSTAVDHTALADVTPPDVPTDLTISIGLTSLWLQWTNPTDDDFSHIDIFENTVDVEASATLIAKVAGTSFARAGLPNHEQRFYWIRAVDVSGNESALTDSVSGTTAELPDAKRLSIDGLMLTPNSPSANKVSWPAFTITYGLPGGTATTGAISAGNATWTVDSLYLYYVEGETVLRTTTSVGTIFTDGGHPIGIYRGGNDVQLTNGTAVVDGNNIIAGTIGATQLVVTDAIITNTLQLADAVVSSAKIYDLDAAKIRASTVIANTIKVGDTGDSLSTIMDRAANPAARVNAGSTLIDPGKILISGTTPLSSWRNGTDATKIEGGEVAANTISANKLNIGLRGLTITDLTFEHNKPAANSVAWTAGTITYVNDAGSEATASVAAGNTAWTTGTLYLCWDKAATSIAVKTTFADATATDRVILATYKGGVWLNANYGRTIIDGSSIKTGSIDTDQLKVGAVTADIISVSSLSAISASLGLLVTGRIQSTDGLMYADFNDKVFEIA